MRSTSQIWPFDQPKPPAELKRENQGHLFVFLSCAFAPKPQADALFEAVQEVCDSIGKILEAKIECVRADKIASGGTIHADIWRYISLADVLLFDVTGLNGNVLVELGVAAATRAQDFVILIRDSDDTAAGGKFLFDLQPKRHLTYTRNVGGDKLFLRRLEDALLQALTPAPYIPVEPLKLRFPLSLDFRRSQDHPELLGPPHLHRRPTSKGLEFGSFFNFEYSWLTVGDLDFDRVSVVARMCFSDLHPGAAAGRPWLGVCLRSSHFFANYGYLLCVKTDGSVWRTVPQSETDYIDKQLGTLKRFSLTTPVTFELHFNKRELGISVNGLNAVFPVKQMPYVRQAGKVRLQTSLSRAILETVTVKR